MRFNKRADGSYVELEQKNVDTGMGLERALCVLNGKSSVYETDIFADTIEKISQLTGRTYGADEETTRAFRVVLDHVRTATFMIGDEKGISPSNTDQGYILRRIIRRAVRYGRKNRFARGKSFADSPPPLSKSIRRYIPSWRPTARGLRRNSKRRRRNSPKLFSRV